MQSMSAQKIIHLLILDESGSMEPVKMETIRALNECFDRIRNLKAGFPEQDHRITFVTFNSSGIRYRLLNCGPIALKPLDETSYRPHAMSPLYDSVVQSLKLVCRELINESGCRVLVTLYTDGLDNASLTFSREDLTGLIEKLKEQGWNFNLNTAGFDEPEPVEAPYTPSRNILTLAMRGMKEIFTREKEAHMAYLNKIREPGSPHP
jgi:hypothetical protein